MASLTTVYMISLILASISGMGSAYVGNTIYPVTGGSVVPATNISIRMPGTIVPVEPVKKEEMLPANITVDNLRQVIKDQYNMDDEFANNVISFIKTPVVLWKEIADTPSELKQKFMRALTHPNLNKCPAKLLDVCKIVNIKYSNMKDFIDQKDYTPYGDQSLDAVAVLSDNL